MRRSLSPSPTRRQSRDSNGSARSISTNTNLRNFTEIPEVKEVVIEEVIIAVKDAIKRKKSSIELFEVANSDYYLQLSKDKFKPSLEAAIEYFVEKEEYDRCIECRDLINKL